MSQICDPTILLDLHKRLLQGDRTASEEIATILLTPLSSQLGKKLPIADPQIVSDGVTDAILDYCENPRQFDAKRGVPLEGFLHMAARRNVWNSVRGEIRRKAREGRYGQASLDSIVELASSAGNTSQETKNITQVRRPSKEAGAILKDEKDQRIYELRMQGERRTQAFAKVLGIDQLPISTQRREVKRAKDRIDKILDRHKDKAR